MKKKYYCYKQIRNAIRRKKKDYIRLSKHLLKGVVKSWSYHLRIDLFKKEIYASRSWSL
jgi:hypothetical protein